jgi:phosphoserine phosphatase
MTLFVLVRHGQTAWNAIERFRGRADLPLNEVGLAQAQAAARQIAARWQPAAIYASPMRRAVQTAEAIGQALRLAVEPAERLADIDFGQWQGLTPDEARQRWPEMVDAWYHAPHLALPPGGESLAEVRQRTTALLAELVARHAGETVVLVGHMVVNRVILLGVMGLGNERFWRLGQDTTAINVFESAGSDFNLLLLNDTCHLRA